MSNSENYYHILEVPEGASGEEIKKSYRKLSLKYHPDKTQGNPEMTEKFQKINEAYETLGNQEKRKQYDHGSNNSFFSDGNEIPPDIHEFFSNVFFGGMGPGMPHGINIVGGTRMNGFPHGNIRIVPGGMPFHFEKQMQKPTPIVKTLVINMKQVLNGANVPLEIERWIIENDNKVFECVTIYVKVEKGVDNNEIVMVPDEGNVLNQHCKGDIKVFIKIENETELQREGLDLVYNKTISLKESLCGFSFELKYINEKVYTIHNQAGNIIPPEFKKIIPNMGLSRENHTGNLVIHFHIDFPLTLEKEKIDSLRNIL